MNWLDKLLGKKDPTKKTESTHTMGPEELVYGDESPRDENDARYRPIESVNENAVTQEMEDDAEGMGDIPSLMRSSMSTRDAHRVMIAALFMSTKAVSLDELSKISGVSILEARKHASEMIDQFNRKNDAIEIVEDVGGYRMKVRAPYDEKVSHLAGSGELSPAELKTLAFIAYKQPLIQSQLVQVRSNTAYDHLQVLLEKGFVSREPKGRTYILRTTRKFSEYFGTHALKLKPMPKKETRGEDDDTA